MKNVTLIGDSIRMGYQQFVEEALKDVARIWGPEINGGDSNNVRTHLPKWLETAADVIHLNCGLHDIKKDYDSGQPQVGVETYRENLCFIF
ncbi:MAG: SGNH/GDSL hydrolase family protein, partial [Gemmatimonadetes bacterium]|nr:SGNH/GDSL hydrolase family protein [Gemmatimonadota bacterium]